MVKGLSLGLKLLIFICSFLGLFLSFLYSFYDGYYNWGARLMYFTGQSNLWIGLLSIVSVFLIIKNVKRKEKFDLTSLYKIRLSFTLSILVTGLVFCCFLGPFADKSYHAWSGYSLLTHAVVPVLSLIDFFIDDYKIVFKRSDVFIAVIPILVYFAITSLLCVYGLSFGRGDSFPYFFMNFYSMLGFFGVSFTSKPYFGTFYWLLMLLLIVFSLGLLLIKFHPQTFIYNKNKKRKG